MGLFSKDKEITKCESDIIKLIARVDNLELAYQTMKTRHIKALQRLNRLQEDENELEEEEDDSIATKSSSKVTNKMLGFDFI
jgi:uncharacterized membrane protein